jgi:L-threonylcarbamoyladenylate synthase
MIDSPSARMTTSAKRSAKCEGWMRQPLGPTSSTPPKSIRSAAAHSAPWATPSSAPPSSGLIVFVSQAYADQAHHRAASTSTPRASPCQVGSLDSSVVTCVKAKTNARLGAERVRCALVEDALAAIRAGKPVIIPTDTVYGLVADGYREAPTLKLYELKRRPESMPCALLAAELDAILDAVPELLGRAAVVARALLPGPYTLVLPNPARRFRWLCGGTPTAIGVRVPDLREPARSLVARAGVLASTSANLHGGPDPRRVADIPEELRARVAAVVDGGQLPGTPSTVLDLTGSDPRVLREGAVPAKEALERARTALAA